MSKATDDGDPRTAAGRAPSGSQIDQQQGLPLDAASSLPRFLSRDELVARLTDLRRVGLSEVRWQGEAAGIEVAIRQAALLRGDESLAMHAHHVYIGRAIAPPPGKRRTGTILEMGRRPSSGPPPVVAKQ